ncbi:MAG TPA: 2TM domain-containing protein [Fimbriimonas sp.]|nr:2TM domain-containing protein [Fimbriimonas sp.]
MADELLKSGEDVDAILRLALKHDHSSSDELRSRLLRSADELGVTPEQLARAEEEYREVRLLDKYEEFRKNAFRVDIVTFVAVMALLNVIWFLTGRNFYWPGIVFCAWGIAVAIDFAKLKVKPTTGDPEFIKWRKKGMPSVKSDTYDAEDV